MEEAIHCLDDRLFQPLHGKPLLSIFATNYVIIMSKRVCRTSPSGRSTQKESWRKKKKERKKEKHEKVMY